MGQKSDRERVFGGSWMIFRAESGKRMCRDGFLEVADGFGGTRGGAENAMRSN